MDKDESFKGQSITVQLKLQGMEEFKACLNEIENTLDRATVKYSKLIKALECCKEFNDDMNKVINVTVNNGVDVAAVAKRIYEDMEKALQNGKGIC